MYNQIQKQRIIGKSDAESALQYLKEQSKTNCAIIFDYSIFGDVLAFDATYGRNKYKFPVVIFSGANHHKQTTVFVVVVVSNETEQTYVWLLEKFVETMNEKQPKCVITDGDLLMKNAIKRNFQKVMYVDVDIDDFNMRLRSKQNSSSMENVDNDTEDQVRDPVRVRTKGRVSGMTSRPKRGNQCGICREIGHNRASCPNFVDSCSRTFDNDFEEE
ncbi:hypothetical protein Lal_00001774 [Lupinus albus]|nr:hypothetical protein Lal_00001774 [Lupinus albus]